MLPLISAPVDRRTVLASFPEFAAAVARSIPARLPTLLFGANPYAASFSGVRFSDCMLDNDLYVECVVRLARHFQPDGLLNVNAGLSTEVLEGRRLVERDGTRYLVDDATGEAVVCVPDDGNPQRLVDGRLAPTRRGDPAQAASAPAPGPEPAEFSDAQLDAVEPSAPGAVADNVRRVNEALAGRVLISTGHVNPCSALVGTFGFEGLCLAMRERPSEVRALANHRVRSALPELRARIEAGARLIYTGSSWVSLISREDYSMFFHEAQALIHRAARRWGAVVILHVTGDQMHLMDLNVASGPDILLLDHVNDLGEVKARFGDQVCLAGGLDPSGALYRGTPDDVRREVEAVLSVLARGGGYVLSTSDCLVLDTPRANIEAMFEVAADFRP